MTFVAWMASKTLYWDGRSHWICIVENYNKVIRQKKNDQINAVQSKRYVKYICKLIQSGEYCYNAYCQFSQQACTNFMQTYLYLLISTHFFVQTTNLHWVLLTTFPSTKIKSIFQQWWLYMIYLVYFLFQKCTEILILPVIFFFYKNDLL